LEVFGGVLLTDEEENENTIKDKEHVIKLHDDRCLSGERNFLEIIEANNFEKLNTWKPTNCVSKSVWYICFFWYWIKHRSRVIIDHPLFEFLVIMLILTNSFT